MLHGENFKTVANYQSILSLAGFFAFSYEYTQDISLLKVLSENESVLAYFNTNKGFVSTPSYFQKVPTLEDTKFHLKVLEVLILAN